MFVILVVACTFGAPNKILIFQAIYLSTQSVLHQTVMSEILNQGGGIMPKK
jgi:hypothetical protein